jgi:hypothetical protein
MAILRLSESLLKGFRIYFSLDPQARTKILDLTNRTVSANSGNKELQEKIIEESILKKKDAEYVVTTLFSVVAGPIETETGFESFIADIIDTLNEQDDPKLKPNPEFKAEISGIFGTVRKRIKAIRLAHEREGLITETQILTDIRPIFDLESSKEISAFTVLHTLRIEYRKEGKTKEVFIAFNRDDLTKLKDQIDRTEQKESAIRNTLSSLEKVFVDIKNLDQ